MLFDWGNYSSTASCLVKSNNLYNVLKNKANDREVESMAEKGGIVRWKLLCLKMGHKEGILYTLTTVMFTNTKG